MTAMRIISLLASGTEIVCASGAADVLVGRSHECDNPEWVAKLPSCTRPAFDINMSSGEIDAEVRRRLKTGEPLYHIDTNLIRELRPDLLITQAHCEVCAVTPGDVERAGGGIMAAQVLALTGGSVQGIFDGIMSVAEAISLPAAGESLIARMRRRMQAVTDAVRDKPAPTVVMLEWTRPIFSMGNWAPELVESRQWPGEARREGSAFAGDRVGTRARGRSRLSDHRAMRLRSRTNAARNTGYGSDAGVGGNASREGGAGGVGGWEQILQSIRDDHCRNG